MTIVITTPERLVDAGDDNTPGAVESATGVPTTAEAIAADGDGSTARVPCIVGAPRMSVNATSQPTREVLYVNLTSGLIVRHLSMQPAAVAEYTTREERIKHEPIERTYVLAHDPWQPRVAQLDTAERCARRLLAASDARYVPAIVTQLLMDSVDHLRARCARADARSHCG